LIVVANEEQRNRSPFLSSTHPNQAARRTSGRPRHLHPGQSRCLNATILPWMHGPTSPLKNACPACSQRQLSLTSATARRTNSEQGSTPKSCSRWSVGSVAVQDRLSSSARQLKLLAEWASDLRPSPRSPLRLWRNRVR
jgi:hypothetical protein